MTGRNKSGDGNAAVDDPQRQPPGNSTPAGRFVAPVLFCVFFLAGACGDIPGGNERPAAVRGVMDVRTRDFVKDGPVPLSGEWEFHWMRFLDPAPGVSREEGDSRYILVPGTWNEQFEYPPCGFATYRLRVLLPPLEGTLGLRFLDLGTAYRVFVNGTEVRAVGTPGETRDTSVPRYRPGVVTFVPGGGELDIVIHVSNFHHRMGGAWDEILLGPGSAIMESREESVAVGLFLLGSFLIMGIYHMVLYSLRRRDPSPLYFALYCLCISLFVITTGERFIIHLFPSMNIKESTLPHSTFPST